MAKANDLFSWPPKAVKLSKGRRGKKRHRGEPAEWETRDTRNYRWSLGQIEHRPGIYCHWLLELRAILCDPQYDEELADFSAPAQTAPRSTPDIDAQAEQFHLAASRNRTRRSARSKPEPPAPPWIHPPPTRIRTPSKEP